MSGHHALSFTPEGLKQRLARIERRLDDQDRQGQWDGNPPEQFTHQVTFAKKAADQAIPANTFTRLDYTNEFRDDSGEYDASTSRLTSVNGGLYLVNVGAFVDVVTSGQRIGLIVKHSASLEYRWIFDDRPSWSGNLIATGGCPVVLGAGEFIEIHALSSAAETFNVGTPETSFLDIVQIA